MEQSLVAFDESQVPIYYSRKTADILHKYGPGPASTSTWGSSPPAPHRTPPSPSGVLKQRIVESQEPIVEHAARSWGAYASASRRLLDIGCGVGGGSLYWAQEHGTHGHRPHRRGRTRPRHRGLRPPGRGRRPGRPRYSPTSTTFTHDRKKYDAAYANESSGYMDRSGSSRSWPRR